MAKGAAKEEALGGLHSLLTKVFQRTLDKYLADLSVLDKFSDVDEGDFEDEFLAAALAEINEPNPAMLSAISKFLKDNDIGVDSAEVENLNSTARRLADRQKARKEAGVNLSVVPHVGEGHG